MYRGRGLAWLAGGVAALTHAVVASAAGVAGAPEWADTPVTRLEALALIQTLDAQILSSSSATLTLEQWCREHALADPPLILARRADTTPAPPTAATRADLQVSDQDDVRYRRVELTCGQHILSVAENWYVPKRLTADMNQQLDGTQTPFGKVVRPLQPHRETIAAQLLWAPLPAGWEKDSAAVPPAGGGPLQLPAALFEHRAVLYTAGHVAIAEVHEVYQRDLLAFPEPHLPDLRPRPGQPAATQH